MTKAAVKRPTVSTDASMTAIDKIESHPDITGLKKNGPSFLLQAQSLTVSNPAQESKAIDLTGEAKRILTKIESLRHIFVDPLNKHIKLINGFFKQVAAPWSDADNIVRDKIREFRDKQEQERLAKQAEINRQVQEQHAQETRAATASGMEAPPPPEPVVVPKEKWVGATNAAASFTEHWDYEVVNFAEVPDEYKILNSALVRKVIGDGLREIPGLKIHKTERLAIHT